MIRAICLSVVIFLTACGSSDANQEIGATSASGAPDVGERFQRSIDRAWDKANAGESPATSCAGLKGRVVGTNATDAAPALHACNVDIPVRYFEVAFLDPIEAGEKNCQELLIALATQLSAMTLSVDAIKGMTAPEQGDEEAVAQALGEAVDREMAEGLEDPEAAIKQRLKPRALQSCPDLAHFLQ